VVNADRLLDGRLKLRHLVLVATIAEQGSVVRAAERLRVTQPVVTRGLRELEAILGVELFDRGPRGVTPTIYGAVFVTHAQAVLTQVRQAGQHIAELRAGDAGTVTAGTHLAGSNVLLPRAIARLKKTRPGLRVIVREATPDVLLADLLVGRVDLTVGRLTPGDDGDRTAQVRLYHEPVRLVTRAGHPALSTEGAPSPALAELLSYPWVLPVDQTSLRRELEGVFSAQGLPLPADRVECTSMPTLRSLLLDTDAIAALPMLITEDDDRLAMLDTPLRSVSRLVGVTVARNRTPSPGAALLLERLHEVAGEIRLRLGTTGLDMLG
jgi:DNA-binding transcriptional LysR family regulator